ncbi:MAG TPA: hypothetical protein VLG09_03025 [Candidatus Saccharimonadales bacterium]|nr:hypothetical protein [Candidatus Saccharimonadales bacterium]
MSATAVATTSRVVRTNEIMGVPQLVLENGQVIFVDRKNSIPELEAGYDAMVSQIKSRQVVYELTDREAAGFPVGIIVGLPNV